jgi:ABC-type multidrug transport system fused ATPase/permease subunit
VRGLRAPRHDDHGPFDPREHGTQAEQFAALTSHIVDVERGVAHGVVGELRALVELAPLAVLLAYLAPRLAGTAVAALGAFGVLAFALRRAFKRANERASSSAAVLVEAADEAVRHAELWATYGATRRIRAHVATIGRSMTRAATRIRVRASLLSSTSEVLGALALVLALVLAAHGYLDVERGTLVPFAIAFFMTYKPLRDFVDARLARARGEEALRAAVGRASADTPSAAPSTDRAPARAWLLDDLVLTDVRARYGTHAPLSVRVPAGSIVAIVGPTGIGKTSLLRGLLGLDALSEGAVHYGGIDLGTATIGPQARPFAWVPQDAPIVCDTLAINVGLGRTDDDAELVDPAPILAALGNRELAAQLGSAILVSERRLSGGERQWIAVARAWMTGLPVLLLDEPTSSLDPASQKRLLEGIVRLRGERTIIVVTHRPEPLRIADFVIRLDEIDDRTRFDRDLVSAKEIAVEDVRST